MQDVAVMHMPVVYVHMYIHVNTCKLAEIDFFAFLVTFDAVILKSDRVQLFPAFGDILLL